MQVLTYVEQELTVINGNSFYKDIATKPSFITGTNFYYEPTLKMMDGVALTTKQITDAEAFITSFVAPIVAPIVVPVKHYVDADGNYLGTNGTIEVASAPTLKTEKWDGVTWVDSCLIDKTTKFYKGIGDTRTADNAEYAPNTVPQDFFSNYYTWDGATWNITLADAQTCRSAKIKRGQTDALALVLGEVASWEPVSFATQEKEARAYLLDKTTATPFLDALLTARNMPDETKDILVGKIIVKADAYATVYADILGKFQSLIYQIQTATTVAEVKLIV